MLACLLSFALFCAPLTGWAELSTPSDLPTEEPTQAPTEEPTQATGGSDETKANGTAAANEGDAVKTGDSTMLAAFVVVLVAAAAGTVAVLVIKRRREQN